MGMMPADRELKWQRVFRRFGLPGSLSEKEPGKENESQPRDGNRKRDEGNKPGEPKSGR